jgi:hypothetical protein
LLLQLLELGDPVLNGAELLLDQREKSRTETGTRDHTVQGARQRLQPFERQRQRARLPDEAQPIHGRPIVLSIARCGSSRRR